MCQFELAGVMEKTGRRSDHHILPLQESDSVFERRVRTSAVTTRY